MRIFKQIPVTFFALLFLVSITSGQNAAAETPTNVGLISFTVTAQTSSALVEWETATELNTAAFSIQRAVGGANFAQIAFLVALGDPTAGAQYEYVDEAVTVGQTYTYKLIEIESNANEIELGIRTVTIGGTATPTAIVIIGNDPTATATRIPATDSPTATPTNPPNATATPTAVSNNNATNTPTATATATRTISNSPTATVATNNTPTPTATTRPAATEVNSTPETVAIGETPEVIASTATAEETGSDNTVFAQEATLEAYPGDFDTGTSNDAENNGQLETPAYPLQTTTPSSSGVTIIGSQNDNSLATNGNTATTNGPNAQDDPASGGRIMLWLGFLLALIVFIAGVIGAIILYRRK